MLSRLILLTSLISAVIILVMLFFTTPSGVGPLGVFAFFVAIYGVMFGVMTLAVRIFVRIVQRRKELKGRDYANAALLAFWPIMVLLSISVGMNVLIAMIVAALAVAIGIVLISKIR